MRHERRGRHAVRGTMLPVYEWIIDLYAPYVLVRCTGFTNDRSQALKIGAYTLITACLMASRLDHTGQLGIAVDVIMEVVGPDVVRGNDNDAIRLGGGALLIPDERMQDLAEALNLLERPLREALVLHHLGGLAEGDMAKVLVRPIAEIASRIRRGERLLTGYLNGSYRQGGKTGPSNVRSLLAWFEAGLDEQWLCEVREYAIRYLARCDKRTSRPPGHGHLN